MKKKKLTPFNPAFINPFNSAFLLIVKLFEILPKHSALSFISEGFSLK